jgi:hypothetical protein
VTTTGFYKGVDALALKPLTWATSLARQGRLYPRRQSPLRSCCHLRHHRVQWWEWRAQWLALDTQRSPWEERPCHRRCWPRPWQGWTMTGWDFDWNLDWGWGSGVHQGCQCSRSRQTGQWGRVTMWSGKGGEQSRQGQSPRAHGPRPLPQREGREPQTLRSAPASAWMCVGAWTPLGTGTGRPSTRGYHWRWHQQGTCGQRHLGGQQDPPSGCWSQWSAQGQRRGKWHQEQSQQKRWRQRVQQRPPEPLALPSSWERAWHPSQGPLPALQGRWVIAGAGHPLVQQQH